MSGSVCLNCNQISTGCLQCINTPSYNCTLCDVGYYIKSDFTCGKCLSGCLNCNSGTSCTSCLSGYYLDSLSNKCVACNDINCDQCLALGVCSQCKSGFYLNSNTVCVSCSSAIIGCLTCDSATSCKKCIATDYLNSSTTCSPCINILTNCQSCNTSPNQCQSCFSPNYVNLTDNTCISQCNSDEVANTTNGTCVKCSWLFQGGCTKCTLAACTGCSSNLYLETSFPNKCVACDGPFDVQDNTTYTCQSNPMITVSVPTIDNFLPYVNINCSVQSSVYFAYGLYGSVNQFSLSYIQSMTGKTIDMLIPTSDSLFWSNYGIGYGAFMNVNPFNNFHLTSVMKNSGESYSLIAAYNGGSVTSGLETWIQPSNGASTAEIKIGISSSITTGQKNNLGIALKKSLNIDRNFYTEEGVLINGVSGRLLDGTNSTNTTINTTITNSTTTTNTSSTSNSTSGSLYTYFYVNPDYTLSNDSMNSLINETLSDSTTFINTLTSNIPSGSGYQVVSIAVDPSISAQSPPSFFNITPTIFNDTNALYIILTLNTDGMLYVGLELFNATGVTKPDWTNFMLRKNASGMALLQSNISRVVGFQNVTVKFSNLIGGANYSIYFGASNLVFPRNYTDIYIRVGMTATTVGNSNPSPNLAEKMIARNIFIIMLAICIFGMF